jgi:hypothetical protein
LNNALCPPGGDHRVCDRVLSNPLAVLKESRVGEHRLGRTVISDMTTPEPPRRETMQQAALNSKKQTRTIASPVE